MANNLKPIIIAVICIIISALISSISVYSRFHSVQSKITDIAYPPKSLITLTAITSTPSTFAPTVPIKNSAPAAGDSVEIAKAMEVLDNFNKYLNEGEYDKAVELFDWESFPDLEVAFAGYYVSGNKTKTFENICKDPRFCLRFHKILKTRKASETEYWFTIQYQTKDGQIYVNSSHVSGTFVKNTDFLYSVKKRNGTFKVAELPNGFNIEAE